MDTAVNVVRTNVLARKKRERERRKVCKNRGKNWTTGETLPVLTCVLHHGCVIIFNDRYLNSLWLWKNTASRFYLISRARIHYRPVVNIAVTLHADIFWKKRSIREYRERRCSLESPANSELKKEANGVEAFAYSTQETCSTGLTWPTASPFLSRSLSPPPLSFPLYARFT